MSHLWRRWNVQDSDTHGTHRDPGHVCLRAGAANHGPTTGSKADETSSTAPASGGQTYKGVLMDASCQAIQSRSTATTSSDVTRSGPGRFVDGYIEHASKHGIGSRGR